MVRSWISLINTLQNLSRKKPLLGKPNDEEVARSLVSTSLNEADVLLALHKARFYERGAKNILLTLGRGAYFFNGSMSGTQCCAGSAFDGVCR